MKMREKCRRADCGFVFSTTSNPNSYEGHFISSAELSDIIVSCENRFDIEMHIKNQPQIMLCPKCQRPSTYDEPIPEYIHPDQQTDTRETLLRTDKYK
jgi:hypothetical protein